VLELAGFRRVDVQPGLTVQVHFRLHISQLAFLDADMRWRVEAGEVDVMVGASSEDIRLRGTLSISEDALIDGAHRAFYAD
jgi:beta-glucosidase